MGDEEARLVWWKLKVGLRVGRFSLKLNLRNRLFSSWKLHRLSFLVRFRKHHLKIDSQSKPDCVPTKSRFGFLRRRKRRVVESQNKLDDAFGAIWSRSLGLSNKARLLGVGVGAVAVPTLIIILYFVLRWIIRE